MAMYEEQGRGNESTFEQGRGSARLEQQRIQVEQLAHVLQQQSMQQWQKAAEGIIALPAAIAVGLAATTLYAVGFVTRGFQALQQQAEQSNQQMRISFDREQQEARGELRGDRRPQRGETRAPDAQISENTPRA
jgi:predicted nucleic acid-binding protein